MPSTVQMWYLVDASHVWSQLRWVMEVQMENYWKNAVHHRVIEYCQTGRPGKSTCLLKKGPFQVTFHLPTINFQRNFRLQTIFPLLQEATFQRQTKESVKPEDEIPVAVATTQDQWRRQRIAKDQVQVAQVRLGVARRREGKARDSNFWVLIGE